MLIGYARPCADDLEMRRQVRVLNGADCKRVVREKAASHPMDETELKPLLTSLKKGDTLIVARLDGLAGSLQRVSEIMRELEDRGVHFHALAEKIDTSEKGGRSYFHAFSVISTFQRQLISQRTKAGLEAARAHGRRGGRRPKLDPAKIKAARAMLRSNEVSRDAIAKKLGVARTTLWRALGKDA